MPNWGLTSEQRELRPWGLDPALLAPCKVTTDEIWGDVYTTVIEQALIDTPPMQRLRRVRQLGTSHLVYPGATHTRFSHSLGAVKVVQDLLDAVMEQREGLHPVPDLFEEWAASAPDSVPRRRAEAIVLGRLGALLHDICHVPFGHSIEDDLGVLPDHDKNAERFARLWSSVEEALPVRVRRLLRRRPERDDGAVASLARLFELPSDGAGNDAWQKSLAAQLRPLIISKDSHAQELRDRGDVTYPFVTDLVGDTICADLLDYLLRDHLNTGLPASLGRRFTSAFFVVPAARGPYGQRAALNVVRSGHERTDVVSELLKALRYRYELSERVLCHHAKLSADAMVGKMLDLWADSLRLRYAEPSIAALDNAEDLAERQDVEGLLKAVDQRGDSRARDELATKVSDAIESTLLTHGDDGLLEQLAMLGSSGAASTTPLSTLIVSRERQAADLARALIARDLFEVAGRVGIEHAPAAELHERFADIDERNRLQRRAQEFAELGSEPQVLIWLPDPKMRLKLAKVLVDDGAQINVFSQYEKARQNRGGDIYRAHNRLWGLWVFTRRDMKDEQRRDVLVMLASEFGVAWERLRDTYGPDGSTWLVRHAIAEIAGKANPTTEEVRDVIDEVATLSHRGTWTTKREFVEIVRPIVSELVR